MKIKVTDLDTNVVTIYDYSKDNWMNRYACMKGDRVHMWAPRACFKGTIIRTSGRLWEVIE